MDYPKSLTERIMKGSFVVVAFSAFAPPLAYLIKMIYSRSLSIEMFGLFFAVIGFFALITPFADLGFGYCLTYLIPKYYKQKNFKTCWNIYKYTQIISLAFSILISIILFSSADWLSRYYFKVPEAKTVIYIFIIFFISGNLLACVDKLFLGLQQERYYALSHPIKMLVILLFSAVLFFIKKSGLIQFSFVWAITTTFIFLLFAFIVKRKNHHLINKITWDKVLFKLMVKYAIPSYLTTIVYAFVSSSDTILLTLLKGVSEVGVYAIIFPLATFSSLILSPVNTFLLPLISHLMEGEIIKIEKIITSALKIIPFVAFYFALFIVIFPVQPISILFGSKWVDMARLPLIIFTIGYIGAQISRFLSTIVVGMGRVKENLRITIIIAIANVVLTYILVNRYSVLGVTISNSIIFILSIILYTKIILKTVFFKFPYIFYLKMLIFGLLTYMITKVLNISPNGLLQYLVTGGIYTLMMSILSYYLKVFNINMLKSLVKL